MPFRRPLIRAVAGLFALIAAQGAIAAELLMFERPGCPWCARWKAEVGPAYPNTPEGRRAPLRQVMMQGPAPRDFPLAEPVIYSPTFVLIEDGREIGRITGYIGEEPFWGLLGVLVKKLDAGGAGGTAKAGNRD